MITRTSDLFQAVAVNRRSLVKSAIAMGMFSTLTPAEQRIAAAQSADDDGLVQVSNGQFATWIRNFNPLGTESRWPTRNGVYEPLAINNRATGEVEPWLATEWAWSEDNLSLTFTTRENVLWSDGEKFTAADVAFTFNLLMTNDALAGTGSVRSSLPLVSKVEATDDTHVVFTFTDVFTPAFYDLADQAIVAEHSWKEVEDPVTFTNETPVGTGPFTEVTKFQDQYWELHKNPNYWQEGKPAVEGLQFPAFTSNDTANLALTNGETDWSADFIADVENTYIAKDPEHFHYWFPLLGGTVLLMLNNQVAPWTDVNIRKAVSMGLDRQQMCTVAVYDYTHPIDATGLSDAYAKWKDEAFVSENANLVTRDVDAANTMLDEAGTSKDGDTRKDADGNDMSFEIIVPSGWSDWVQVCQIISQNLKDLGIKVEVRGIDEGSWGERTSTGDYSMSLGFSNSGATPLDFYRGVMDSSAFREIGVATSTNQNRYNGGKVDATLLAFGQTSDEAEQMKLAQDMQTIFVEEWPVLPLYPAPQFGTFSTRHYNGFPDADNPFAILQPGGNESIIVMNAIVPNE